MARQIAQRCLAFAGTGFGIASPEQHLGPRLVDLRHEAEAAGVRIPQPRDRPAGQDAGKRLDVLLRIAAIDAERVQLEDLTAEILVESLAGAPADQRVGPDRLNVVEVEAHPRMARHGEQHIGEAAGDVRADRLALEGADEAAHHRAHRRNREVIAPEEYQPLEQRRLAGDRRVHPGADLGEEDGAQLVLGAGLLSGLLVDRFLVEARLQHGGDHRPR